MLTKNQVQHIAKLARLGLTEAEIEKFTKDLSRILEYVSELQQVDTKDIEPIAHITGLENAMRDDDRKGAIAQSTPELLIDQAPQREDGYWKVPAVFGEIS